MAYLKKKILNGFGFTFLDACGTLELCTFSLSLCGLWWIIQGCLQVGVSVMHFIYHIF